MVIPYAVIRGLKALGLQHKDWLGNLVRMRLQASDNALVLAVVGHPDFVDEISELGSPSHPVFSPPEPAARALADPCCFTMLTLELPKNRPPWICSPRNLSGNRVRRLSED